MRRLSLIQPNTQSSIQSSADSLNHISTSSSSSQTTQGNYTTILSVHSKTISWILDIGATDNICYSLSLFSFYKRITPIKVKILNGTYVTASLSRTIHFSPSLSLVDVLYIRKFTFNLVFVTKLTSLLNCSIIFQNSHCFIQDLPSWKMVDLAEIKEGLYILTKHAASTLFVAQTFVQIPNTSYSSFDLWLLG